MIIVVLRNTKQNKKQVNPPPFGGWKKLFLHCINKKIILTLVTSSIARALRRENKETNTLCCHSLQDRQAFLALQCCCFHMLSVGQCSVQVDPKVSQTTGSFNYSSIKYDCWHCFACCSQECTIMPFLVWIDLRSGTTGLHCLILVALV